MIKFGTVVAAFLVIAVIIYGSIQAQEEFSDGVVNAVATSIPLAILQPTATPVADPVVLTGSAFVIQVRGGDNPCRYLYQGNGVGTFAGGQIVLEFVAGTHEANLAATNEMALYGDTGPHLFAIVDAGGATILEVPVDRGATVYADVLFPHVGLYSLYDRQRPDLGQVGEIFAREVGEPGYFPLTGWAGECAAEGP